MNAASAISTIVNDAPAAILDRIKGDLAKAESLEQVLSVELEAATAQVAAKEAIKRGKALHLAKDQMDALTRMANDCMVAQTACKQRLADEYDAAQERGEVANGRPKSLDGGETFQATSQSLGLRHAQPHVTLDDASQEAGEVAGHGGDKTSNVGGCNVAPTAADHGLCRAGELLKEIEPGKGGQPKTTAPGDPSFQTRSSAARDAGMSKEIEPGTGKRTDKPRAGGAPRLTRTEAARDAGELLKEIEPQPGKRTDKPGGGAPTKLSRAEAARDAGMSKRQQTTRCGSRAPYPTQQYNF